MSRLLHMLREGEDNGSREPTLLMMFYEVQCSSHFAKLKRLTTMCGRGTVDHQEPSGIIKSQTS